MPDMNEVYDALRKANDSGNQEEVKKLSAYLLAQESQRKVMGTKTPDEILATKSEPPSALEAIAESGGMGAAISAVAPELVSNVAAPLAAMIPGVGEVAGPALYTAGRVMRANRMAGVAAGAVQGLVSESAGQVYDKATDTSHTWSGLGVRTAAGFGVPALAQGAKTLGTKATSSVLLKLTGKIMEGDGSGSPATVKEMQRRLEQLKKLNLPEHTLHEALAHGAAEDLKAADAKAKEVVQFAQERAATMAKTDEEGARRFLNSEFDRAAQIRNEATKRGYALNQAVKNRLETATRVHALADKELQEGVARFEEPSIIGRKLRDKVVQRNQAELEARTKRYNNTVQIRDQIVAEKEAAGITVDQTQAAQQLQRDIERKLLLTDEGKKAASGMAEVKEPGIKMAYQKVYDALKEHKDGEEVFKTSFEALDHVRRKLGDVIAGKEVEGYGALNKNIAQDLYAQLSKIQKEFVGETAGFNPQTELLDAYHASSENLKKYGTVAGKKITAMDKVDLEKFAKDPADLPKSFFRSQQGIKDLIELTGDKALVTQLAQEHTSRELMGQSSKQVRSWLQKNSDWVKEVPELQSKVAQYAGKLEKIERVEGKLERSAARASDDAEDLRKTAPQSAEKIREEALKKQQQMAEGTEKAYKATTEKGLQEAQNIREATKERVNSVMSIAKDKDGVVGTDFQKVAIKKLLTEGSKADMLQAVRYADKMPNGKQAMKESIVSLLSKTAPASLQENWENKFSVILREGRLASAEEIARIDKGVQEIVVAHRGPERMSRLARYLRRSITELGLAGVNATP